MLQFQVKQEFDKAIEDIFLSMPDVARALQEHPRKHLAIENICREVAAVEAKSGNLMTAETFKMFVRDVARNFCSAAIEYWHQENKMSQAEKQRRLDEQAKFDALEQEIKTEDKVINLGDNIDPEL